MHLNEFRQGDFVTLEDKKLTTNGSPTQTLAMMSVRMEVLSKLCTKTAHEVFIP